MDLVWAVGVFGSTLLAIALMAFFALRPESKAPKCPRCDASLTPSRAECPRCKLPITG